MKKTIITVVGNDTVGIIAKVCTYLAQNQVNILDISQTIVQGYFNMMMVTDATKCEKSAAQIADELEESVEDIQLIYDIVNKHAPEYDVDAITAEVLEVQEKYE